MYRPAKKIITAALTFVLSGALLYQSYIPVSAASLAALEEDREARMLFPIQSNEINNWPDGPAIGAESAILMDAGTGTILYSKNIHDRAYPASTTKLLTCLVAAEHAKLDETVTFSREAVFSLPKGSSNIGMDTGQALSMEECLYGILVGSANEVANAVAEHIGGSMEGFAAMMNEKAREIGCETTNFTNANGLHEDNHYTSAYDLAVISRAFYQNELLAKISGTSSYHFKPTADQPDDFVIRTHHKLVTSEYPYEGIIGGKTGYTDTARQTLVTCAEKNGLKLICVIIKEESPNQFVDTQMLFDYGFSNFELVNVKDNDKQYNIDTSDFFQTNNDIFGSSKPILSLNAASNLVLPKTAVFEDVTSSISYDAAPGQVARIDYTYHGVFVGSATIDTVSTPVSSYNFESSTMSEHAEENPSEDENIVFVNVKKVLLFILTVAGIIILLVMIRSILVNYSFGKRQISRKRRRRRNRGRMKPPYKDIDY